MEVKNKEKYCPVCGTKNIFVAINNGYKKRFDEQTGKRIMQARCPNTSCPKGCEENGGHEWSGWSGGWFTSNRTRKCERCGEEESSGYY